MKSIYSGEKEYNWLVGRRGSGGFRGGRGGGIGAKGVDIEVDQRHGG